MEHKGTVTLTTPRLALRRLAVDDAQAMFDTWASDPEVTRYLTWQPHPDVEVTRKLLEMWVADYEKPGVYNWGIEFKGRLVGTIGVVAASDRDENAEIGYCLGRAYWGKGLMTEALSRLLDFFFGEVGLHRVYLRHAVENVGSGQVMRKAGLTYEGILRGHHRLNDGRWYDLAYYGILRPEWEAMRAPKEG